MRRIHFRYTWGPMVDHYFYTEYWKDLFPKPPQSQAVITLQTFQFKTVSDRFWKNPIQHFICANWIWFFYNELLQSQSTRAICKSPKGVSVQLHKNNHIFELHLSKRGNQKPHCIRNLNTWFLCQSIIYEVRRKKSKK